MKKDNLIFALLGLVIGAIVGFVFANSVNKTSGESAAASNTAPAANSGTRGGTSGNPALPPDHPPLGTSGGASDGSQGMSASGAVPQVTEAIERAKQAPQDFEAQMTAGDLYYQIQRYADAAQFYEAAHKLRPKESEPIVKTGNSHFDVENYTEAEKWYLLALEKDAKNVNVRTDLGLTYFLREPRDVERAIKEFQASLELKPNDEIALQNLALAYNHKGDTEAFRSTIEKLKKVNPDNPAVKKSEGV